VNRAQRRATEVRMTGNATRSRENTRARLLEAAALVFAEEGLDAATVEAVCARRLHARRVLLELRVEGRAVPRARRIRVGRTAHAVARVAS
jgi:hypothetical protein